MNTRANEMKRQPKKGRKHVQEAVDLALDVFCQTSPTKPRRRTKADIRRLEQAVFQILFEDHPQTVRQVYYQAVCRGIIDKTEGEYKNTICRNLANMRRRGTLRFDWLADNTRWMRKPTSYRSLQSALLTTQAWYRRDLWDEQDCYVEVWLEKEALAGVLVQVTEEWDVPLMVTRSFLYSAAEQIKEQAKPTFLYYFGDYDPSGMDITRCVDQGIRQLAPDADITFQRVAVTEGQIEEFNLPTRPTKKSDSRSKGFGGQSVEVDAIAAATLRDICRDCIVQHIDESRLAALREIESQERETLSQIAESYGGAA